MCCQRRNRILDIDLVPVQRKREARDEAGLQNNTYHRCVGIFWCKLQIADGAAQRIPRFIVAEWIGYRRRALAGTAVQLTQIGCPDIAGPRGAEAYVPHRRPDTAHLPGRHTAAVAIVGVADGAVEGERLGKGLALKQRQVHFPKNLFNRHPALRWLRV